MNYHIIQVFLFFPSLYKEYKGTKKMKTRKTNFFLVNLTLLCYCIIFIFIFYIIKILKWIILFIY